LKVEAHLIAEDAQRPGAGPVLFARPRLANVAQEIEILPHCGAYALTALKLPLGWRRL
jgi:hypothetical protein